MTNRIKTPDDGLVVSVADLDAAAPRAQQWRDRFDTSDSGVVPPVGADEAAEWFFDLSSFGALLRLAAHDHQAARRLLVALLSQDEVEMPHGLLHVVTVWSVAGAGVAHLSVHIADAPQLDAADRSRLVRWFTTHAEPLLWRAGAALAGRSDLTDEEAELLAASPWTEVVDAVAANPHVEDHLRVFAGTRRGQTSPADDIDFVF